MGKVQKRPPKSAVARKAASGGKTQKKTTATNPKPSAKPKTAAKGEKVREEVILEDSDQEKEEETEKGEFTCSMHALHACMVHGHAWGHTVH
jgi:hypothetical protein